MAKLIVSGAGGRMGRLLVAIIRAPNRPHQLAGALEAKRRIRAWQDAGEVAGVGKLGVAVTADYAAARPPGYGNARLHQRRGIAGSISKSPRPTAPRS